MLYVVSTSKSACTSGEGSVLAHAEVVMTSIVSSCDMKPHRYYSCYCQFPDVSTSRINPKIDLLCSICSSSTFSALRQQNVIYTSRSWLSAQGRRLLGLKTTVKMVFYIIPTDDVSSQEGTPLRKERVVMRSRRR